jgi:hypothetical protein
LDIDHLPRPLATREFEEALTRSDMKPICHSFLRHVRSIARPVRARRRCSPAYPPVSA